METKEQCKNCEIINADCEGCKEFNKNIRNSDSETKEQKIERLKAKIKKEKWWYNQWNKTALSFVSGCMKWQIKQTIVKLEQQLKELEDDTRN